MASSALVLLLVLAVVPWDQFTVSATSVFYDEVRATVFRIGTRWQIKQEGEYLVFRDLGATTESRYSMSPNAGFKNL